MTRNSYNIHYGSRLYGLHTSDVVYYNLNSSSRVKEKSCIGFAQENCDCVTVIYMILY